MTTHNQYPWSNIRSSTMASHINDLPVEILSNILQRVHDSSTLPQVKDFVGLLSCCQYWHKVAKPILWRDVVLTNSTINTFISKTSPEICGFIRSLELRLTAKLDDSDGVHPDIDHESYYGPRIRALWHDLQNLAPVVRTVTSLNTFSLIVCDEPGYELFCSFRLRIKDLKNLLDSLPLSCVNLELHTCEYERQLMEAGKNSSTAIHHHLCTVMAVILPRLRNLRLQPKVICELLYPKKTNACPASWSTR